MLVMTAFNERWNSLCASHFAFRSEHFSPPVQIKVYDGDAVYFGAVCVCLSPIYSPAIATTIGYVGLLFFTSESVKGKRGV